MKSGLKVLLGAEMFHVLAIGMLGPIYAIFVGEIGGDILAASFAWFIFSIISGVGIYIMGRVEDKLRKDELMVIVGYAIACLGILGYYFVLNKYHLFLVQVILGIGTAVYVPAYDSLYTKSLEKGKFASQWAAWESMYYISTAIAAIIGGLLAKLYGFRLLFLVMFVFSLIGIFVVSYLFHRK